MRRRRKLGILAAVLLLLLGGGAAAAYLVVNRPVADVHNGASSPFTSQPEPTNSTASTSTGNDFGPAWPMYGLDPAHTRDASQLTAIRPPYRLVWKRPAHGVLEYPPSYAHGVLYEAADTGSLVAYQARTAEVLWSRRFVKVLNQPAYYHGRIYFGSYDHNVYALDAATGTTVWKRSIGTAMESPPTMALGRLYIGGLDGTVRAMDWQTGRVLWTYHASGAVKGAVSLSGGRLYFGDYSGVLYCLGSNGRLVWRTATHGLSSGFRSGTFYSTANVRYGRVYIGNTDGKIYSFVASSGRVAWTRTIDGWVYGSPAVWNGMVFETGYDGTFQALDARTGDVRWSTRLPYKTTSSPTVIGNYVYVASHGRSGIPHGNLWAFDPRTGRKVWHFPDGWYSTVVAAGLDQLIVTGPRYLYLLRSKN